MSKQTRHWLNEVCVYSSCLQVAHFYCYADIFSFFFSSANVQFDQRTMTHKINNPLSLPVKSSFVFKKRGRSKTISGLRIIVILYGCCEVQRLIFFRDWLTLETDLLSSLYGDSAGVGWCFWNLHSVSAKKLFEN